MKTSLIIILIILNIYLIFLHKKAEGISFEPRDCVQTFTPCSYLKECLDRKEFIRAFRFARSEANKENPEPEILLKLSELYAKGLGTEKNKTKANYYLTRYFQSMGVHSGK